MHRTVSDHLVEWLRQPGRLPLVVRGARQVGKTWLIRDLATRAGLDLVECNFERDPSLARCFAKAASPARVLDDLGLVIGREVRPERSLLFLDEVQARGDVLAELRWFAEAMPALPVVAAGSLLEFVLADHEFTMPVGRVAYLHVGPMTFPEVLAAHGEHRLIERLRAWRPGGEDLGDVVHARAMRWWTRHVMTGGMPAVVAADCAQAPGDGAGAPSRDATVRRIQSDLAATYRDDFPKYARRADPHDLDAVLCSVVAQLGSRFVASHVGEGLRHSAASRGLELLTHARLCHLVPHTAANGIPLGAEANQRIRKVLLLDTGIAHAILATPVAPADVVWDRLAPQVRGRLTEQAVGQELLALREPWAEPSLHHWQRGGGRPGEIDYVLQIDGRVIPLETKSGAAGSMKSLHQFMHDKRLDLAVRCDANPPGVLDVDVRTTRGDPSRYRLLGLPPYLLWRAPEIVAELATASVAPDR